MRDGRNAFRTLTGNPHEDRDVHKRTIVISMLLVSRSRLVEDNVVEVLGHYGFHLSSSFLCFTAPKGATPVN